MKPWRTLRAWRLIPICLIDSLVEGLYNGITA
jgi:hypothetical protein